MIYQLAFCFHVIIWVKISNYINSFIVIIISHKIRLINIFYFCIIIFYKFI